MPGPLRKVTISAQRYDYEEPHALASEFGFTLHVRARGEEVEAKRQAGARARRWVVDAIVMQLQAMLSVTR